MPADESALTVFSPTDAHLNIFIYKLEDALAPITETVAILTRLLLCAEILSTSILTCDFFRLDPSYAGRGIETIFLFFFRP